MRYNPVLSRLAKTRMFITQPAYQAELAHLFAAMHSDIELPVYSDTTNVLAKKLSYANTHVTTNFSDTNIEDGSIALHRIEGTIFSEYDPWGWYFSTMQLIDDLKAAEANEKIAGHFFYVKSGGGDSYYLDIAAAVIKGLKKPSLSFTQEYMCSAAYYLAANTNKIIANTQFDTIGSIGTMVSFWDMIPYFEKLGFKHQEHYSNYSPSKNKKYNDLLKGKPEEFIKAELDPLAKEFRKTVTNARPQVADAPSEVLEGQTYYTPQAIEYGLIDGQMLIEDAVLELRSMIEEHNSTNSNRQSMLNLINE